RKKPLDAGNLRVCLIFAPLRKRSFGYADKIAELGGKSARRPGNLFKTQYANATAAKYIGISPDGLIKVTGLQQDDAARSHAVIGKRSPIPRQSMHHEFV